MKLLLSTLVFAVLIAVSLPLYAVVKAPLSKEKKDDEQGFVSLFNGKDFEGWQGPVKNYSIEKDAFFCKKGTHGKLYTKKQYGDFILRFEFLLTPGANNGLAIRAPLTGNPSYTGMELQILDNTKPQYKKHFRPDQMHGAIYGVLGAKTGHLKPVGEWNSQEVICKGKQVKVTLNGKVILDADVHKLSKTKTPDGKKHPGLMKKKGHLAILGHRDRVGFRNVRIKSLD